MTRTSMAAVAAGFAVLTGGAALASEPVQDFQNDEIMRILTAAGYHGLHVVTGRQDYFAGYDLDGTKVLLMLHPTSGHLETWYPHSSGR